MGRLETSPKTSARGRSMQAGYSDLTIDTILLWFDGARARGRL